MEFLAPLMLVGAAGAAIPVVVHLIGRKRARIVRFAAIDFLLGSDRKARRRLKLREWLLLAARIAVCLAIPLALAKPYTSCSYRGPSAERGPQAAVLVIDNSFAMAYVHQGVALLDRAKRQAHSLLAQLGPAAEVAIVAAAENQEAPSSLSRDHIRLRDTITELAVAPRPADMTTALARAAQLLTGSAQARRTVFVLSPLAATGFRQRHPAWSSPPGLSAHLVPLVDENDTLGNRAVVDVRVEPDPTASTRSIQVVAQIANFGSESVDAAVALRVGDRIVARGRVTIAPWQRHEKHFSATLPADARSADVAVELEDDPLSADNTRYVRAHLHHEVRALLVDGDPRTVRHDDELFYLEAALRPGDRSDSGIGLATITRDALATTRLVPYDVIVLANVRALARHHVDSLAWWVGEGGGLFIAVGDNVDADAYNREMAQLLPAPLQNAYDATFGSRAAERSGRALRLTKLEFSHPIFAVFSQDAPALREARFDKIMLLAPTAEVDERRVLARFSTGAAALVEARLGRGRVLLYCSSADRDWNDLPIHAGYLPLVQQIVRYLAGRETQSGQDPVLVGHTVQIPVAPDDARFEIQTPRGRTIVAEGRALRGRTMINVSDTEEPGFYRVAVTNQAGTSRAREEATFAVNLDPRGSDLRPLPADEWSTPAQQAGPAKPAAPRRRVELWHAVAAVLLGLLLLESLLTLR